jgi:hypothetical protein
MRKTYIALGFGLLLANAVLCRAETIPSISGLWEWADSDLKGTGVWYLFEKRDNVYFGRLVKVTKNKAVLLVAKCPNGNKKVAMLGLTYFYELKVRDGHDYYDGKLFDPRSGTVYHVWMRPDVNAQELAFREIEPVVNGHQLAPLVPSAMMRRLPDDAMKAEDIPEGVSCE